MELVAVLWVAVAVLALVNLGLLVLIWRQDQEIDRLGREVEKLTESENRART